MKTYYKGMIKNDTKCLVITEDDFNYVVGNLFGDDTEVFLSNSGICLIAYKNGKNISNELVYSSVAGFFGIESVLSIHPNKDMVWIEYKDGDSDEDIYRKVWKENVTEDVRARINEIGANVDTDDIDRIAHRYVYEDDYNCNVSYWDNLDNLIGEYGK